jgi:DNA polymerase-3 subunit beta
VVYKEDAFMKFSVTRDQLFHTLQNVISVVPAKTTMPILQNVKIYTEDGLLKMMATDIEIMLVGWTSAEIIEEGATTIPARTLFDIIRELPQTELKFEIDEFDRTLIKTKFGEYKLSGQDAAEFPKVPVIDAQAELTVKSDLLYRIIDKTLYTCGKDDLRPALNGVFFHAEGGKLTAVSTDSTRLSKFVVDHNNTDDMEIKALIPTRALNYLIRLLEDEGDSIIYLGEKHILFNVKDTLVYSRLIYQDQFPDYTRILPTDFSHELVVNKDDLLASIKRVRIFASQITHQVYFNVSETTMDISAEDVDFGGEGRESIGVKFNGNNFYLIFNANYLLEILQHIDSETIVMKLNTTNTPTIIKAEEDTEGEDYLALLMPVTIETETPND